MRKNMSEEVYTNKNKSKKMIPKIRNGSFIVIEKIDIKKDDDYLYQCRCRNPECCHSLYLTENELKEKDRKCPECNNSLRNRDYVGEKTGSFIVLRKTQKKKKGYYLYECKCQNPECGHLVYLKADEIKMDCRRCPVCYKSKQDVVREKKMNTTPETFSQFIYINCFGYDKDTIKEDRHIKDKLKKILTDRQYDVFVSRHCDGVPAKTLAEKYNLSRQSISTIDRTAMDAIAANKEIFTCN